jgi:lipoprotein-anchoring transpeptidase ErfK/SrfK
VTGAIGRFVPRALAAIAAAVVAGAGAFQASSFARPTAEATRCAPGSSVTLGDDAVAYVAVPGGRRTIAYRGPGRRPFARFGRTNANGVPTVFGVVGAVVNRRCRSTWYRVQLPMRPNGVTGFVRASAVGITNVRARLDVDLTARRVTLFDDGVEVLSTRAAIGTPRTPTPLGRYYVTQRLVPRDPRGPYGPGAVGISAFSNVLTGWTQGGPIGIHGTNQPQLIGRRISNGCIRVVNSAIRRIFAAALPGTPVLIHR